MDLSRFSLLAQQHSWINSVQNLANRPLAKFINQKVEEHLKEFLAYQSEVDEKYPQYKDEFEKDFYFYAFSTEFKNSCMGLNHSRDLLKAFGLKDNDIEQELRDGLVRIKEGKEPFLPNKPISKTKMIYVLDNWREGKKHKAIKAIEQRDRDEFIKKNMNAKKQAEIAMIRQKIEKQKRRVEEIGEKMIKAIEEDKV
jgi:hypothetical protein